MRTFKESPTYWHINMKNEGNNQALFKAMSVTYFVMVPCHTGRRPLVVDMLQYE